MPLFEGTEIINQEFASLITIGLSNVRTIFFFSNLVALERLQICMKNLPGYM